MHRCVFLSICVQDYCLSEFLQDQSSQVNVASDPQGFKRHEAIWELFTSECIYFLDQLMVLKEVTPNEHTHANTHTHSHVRPQIQRTKPK